MRWRQAHQHPCSKRGDGDKLISLLLSRSVGGDGDKLISLGLSLRTLRSWSSRAGGRRRRRRGADSSLVRRVESGEGRRVRALRVTHGAALLHVRMDVGLNPVTAHDGRFRDDEVSLEYDVLRTSSLSQLRMGHSIDKRGNMMFEPGMIHGLHLAHEERIPDDELSIECHVRVI